MTHETHHAIHRRESVGVMLGLAARLGLMASATPGLSTLCLLALFFALTCQSRSLLTHWESLLLGAALVAAAVLMVSVKPASDQRQHVECAANETNANPEGDAAA